MPIKAIARTLGDRYVRFRAHQAWSGQRFRVVHERPVEYAYVLQRLNEAQPEAVLDVGSGQSAFPSVLATCGFVVTASDNVADYWPDGMLNRHWHVVDDDIRDSGFADDAFDATVCISTLEHIPEHDAAVREMLRVTKPGGYVIITAPYNERVYHPNVYTLPDALYGQDLPYVCQSFSRAEVDGWLRDGAELVDQEFWRAYTGDLWATGAFVHPLERTGPDEPHQLTCLTIRKP